MYYLPALYYITIKSSFDDFFIIRSCFILFMFSFFMVITETLRALALLEDYHAKLSTVPDNDLQVVMKIVISVFKSRLFQALVGN